MSGALLILLGEKIKEKRTEKKITLEQLARKAGVTKGLLSQIENNRSLPSLPVLFSIIHSLDENVKDFFADLQQYSANPNPVLIIRKAEHQSYKKEPVKGFLYSRIFSKNIAAQTIDISILELEPGAARKKFIETQAFECKYFLEGQVEYQVENEVYHFLAGDTLFFDGRKRHRLKNTGTKTARILVIYFF